MARWDLLSERERAIERGMVGGINMKKSLHQYEEKLASLTKCYTTEIPSIWVHLPSWREKLWHSVPSACCVFLFAS